MEDVEVFVKDNITRVLEFAQTYNVFYMDDVDFTTVVDEKVRVMRYKLIAEENEEYLKAALANDKVQILDALSDLEYVIDGTVLTYGLQHKNIKEHPVYINFRNDLHEHIESIINMHNGLEKTGKGSIIILLNSFMNMALQFYSVHNMYYEGGGQAFDKWENEGFLDSVAGCEAVLDTMFEVHGMEGLRHEAALEVHRSNMSKLGDDGKPIYDPATGKVLKGPNYSPPNLKDMVEEYFYE